MNLRIIVASLATLVAGLTAAHAAEPNMGVISFENSGAPAAQADFIKSLASLHNFQYPLAARRSSARRRDPELRARVLGRSDVVRPCCLA